jgi:hypothetical protein
MRLLSSGDNRHYDTLCFRLTSSVLATKLYCKGCAQNTKYAYPLRKDQDPLQS